MNKDARIFVAGHRGMAGSAIVRKLEKAGYHNILVRTSAQLDLRRQEPVERFFDHERPEYVFLAAAKVGGIQANNTLRADFLYDNLAIESNVIHAAHRYGVKKLLFLGSSCIYPKSAPQPLKEEYLLTGPLELTNEPYAIAKIAGIKLCQSYRDQYGCDFISVMPTNLYGPNDNYDLQQSHVLPALIRKFHEARSENHSEVTLWGTGTPMREFLHVDDLADAALFLMERYSERDIINVGFGKDIKIGELAQLIASITGYTGKIVYDSSRPDGTPRKLMDSSRILAMGWKPNIPLAEGIRNTYSAFLSVETS